MKEKPIDWQVGDWVKLIETNPPEYKQVDPWDVNNELEGYGTFWDFEPVQLTPDILASNGWMRTSEVMVFKGIKPYLGWNITNHKFYLAYGELPNPVDYVHQVQAILKVFGMKDKAYYFKIKTCNFQEK